MQRLFMTLLFIGGFTLIEMSHNRSYAMIEETIFRALDYTKTTVRRHASGGDGHSEARVNALTDAIREEIGLVSLEINPGVERDRMLGIGPLATPSCEFGATVKSICERCGNAIQLARLAIDRSNENPVERIAMKIEFLGNLIEEFPIEN